jgi:hypothetical protein
MPPATKKSAPLIEILLGSCVVLLILFLLVLSSDTTQEPTTSNGSASIPLGTGNLSNPGQIQGGGSYVPQQAAPMSPGDLDGINL